MVLTIDFYELKERIKKEIVSRLEFLDFNESSFEGAILFYSLYLEESGTGVYLEKNLPRFVEWAISENAGSKNKDLASLSIFCVVCDEDQRKIVLPKLSKIVRDSLDKTEDKFNPLNSAEQFYFLSISSKFIDSELKDRLRRFAENNIGGNFKRKSLFSASYYNLDGIKKFDFIDKNITELQDLISSLWFLEVFDKENLESIEIFWKKIGEIIPYVEIDPESEEEYRFSENDLFMLFVALLIECKNPNPLILFGLYPFVTEIKSCSLKYFISKSYPSAVFEATKKFNEFLKQKTRVNNKDEDSLVQYIMSPRNGQDYKTAMVQFNDNLNETTGINEQVGLMNQAKAIFKAYRNPFGHKPEDHNIIKKIGPFEALSQLISIDYLWKRVDGATILVSS